MTKNKIKIGNKEIDLDFGYQQDVPRHWIELINKLHPITAIVVWDLLNNKLTPLTISLAKYSPDWEKYVVLRIVGGGNPEFCEDVAQIAQMELEEMFDVLVPGYTSNQVLH